MSAPMVKVIIILLPGYQCQCCGDVYCPTNGLFQYFSVGINTCTQANNDFVNGFAIAISGFTILTVLLWIIFCLVKNIIDSNNIVLINDNIFALVMTDVGVSLTLSSCYPKQVAMTAYIIAFGFIIKSYSWTKVINVLEFVTEIPDCLAMTFNTFIVWLAAITITDAKSCKNNSQKVHGE